MADLYESAARVIDLAQRKKGNVKSLCFNSRFSNKRKLYALVCQTLKYRKIIKTLLESLDLDETEEKIDVNLQLVTVYEMLFGKGINVGGEIGSFAKLHESTLSTKLMSLQNTDSSLMTKVEESVILPRYVRVNCLKTDKNDVIETLKKDGFCLKSSLADDFEIKCFRCDPHIPELLIFSQGTDLHQHPLYRNGHIFLQDKASCLPAFLLQPRPNADVIDACAAPGNKTTQLASIMQNQGKIFAFDMDEKRLELLKKQIKKSGAKNIQTKHQDFLKINPNDPIYKKVEYILLDPSCSGSGMVSRMEKLLDEKPEDQGKLKKRLEALSKFQYAMLCHALSFPGVEKVSYSTCSIHQQENEDVVERVLCRYRHKFSLIHLLPSWKHRGLSVFEEGFKCLRASPQEDHTNGFFVAVFERINGRQNDEDKLESNVEGQINNKRRKRKRTKKYHETPLKKDKVEQNLHVHRDLHKNETSKYSRKRRRKIVRKPVTMK